MRGERACCEICHPLSLCECLALQNREWDKEPTNTKGS